VLTPYATSTWMLVVLIGVIAAGGGGMAGLGVLMSAVARVVPAEKRGFASGMVNAGGSFGQFLFAPLLQAIIGLAGWVAAMLTMAAVALLTIPLAWPLRERHAASANAGDASSPAGAAPLGLSTQLRIALRDPSYLCLHAGFFTCGFHIAFLVTHLPQEVQLCGLPATVASWSIAIIGLANIAGSLLAGAATGRYRSKHILAAMYGSRAALIAWYLIAPKTALTFYIFGAGLGLT
jgi:predicted MFS family arabinose efflux permease